MGWKGEGYGLGKAQQGITKPIEVDQIRKRSGIGCHLDLDFAEDINELENENTIVLNESENVKTIKNAETSSPYQNKFNKKRKAQDFRNNIQRLLKNFISSLTEEDLVFDKGLTAEERALVHKEANRLGLKTRSRGNGENRFLVAQKKRSASELMDTIKNNGGQFSKYELISKGDLK